MPVTRFAPSPTGYLHLGHAYSAMLASSLASMNSFKLRIEDIDPIRCKPEFSAAILEDLAWLGLQWPQPVRFQSQHYSDYAAALAILREKDLVYPCFCTRSKIQREMKQVMQAPHEGEDIQLYQGTCRSLSIAERNEKLAQYPKANWRLDAAAAYRMSGPIHWHERYHGSIDARPEILGDVIIARKDIATSYHLSVTVDDHLQGITYVTRGEDLLLSTHVHRLLQAILGFETPEYYHHKLLKDGSGRRYAKRDKSVTLRSLREQGHTADFILRQFLPEWDGSHP